MCGKCGCGITIAMAAMPHFAFADTTGGNATVIAANWPSRVETVVVTGRRAELAGLAQSANQGSVSAEDIALRPLLRPGEIVENIPGVIVTQHSGSGKANQYFLRGFNLDHGTDLAISVDGIGVNMPTHAHGQGYSDLNFLIPELIERVDYKKGPYYADVGDFGAAGAFDVRYYDTLPGGLARVEGGQFGYGRAVVADNAAIGQGILLYAVELEHNDGPWRKGDDARKLNGVLRYSLGDETDHLSVTAEAYHDIWNSTDQVPDRAIASGLIDRWGAIDPSDGGTTGRYALSLDWQTKSDTAKTHVLVYGMHYNLNLFSNFTYFLDDPIHGDQIEQQDNRFILGGKASQSWLTGLFDDDGITTVGLDIRNDVIRNGLFHTERRVRLDARHVDDIMELSVSPYIENETHWTPWFRTDIGLRGDLYWGSVSNIAGGNSGDVRAAIVSPKLGLISALGTMRILYQRRDRLSQQRPAWRGSGKRPRNAACSRHRSGGRCTDIDCARTAKLGVPLVAGFEIGIGVGWRHRRVGRSPRGHAPGRRPVPRPPRHDRAYAVPHRVGQGTRADVAGVGVGSERDAGQPQFINHTGLVTGSPPPAPA